MRQKFVITTMALAALAAGSARANDATQVIYDMSALQAPARTVAANPAGSGDVQVPFAVLPVATPSVSNRNGDAGTIYDDSSLEVLPPTRGRSHGTDAGGQRGEIPRQDPPTQPSPTPEPGTMLLLGGALASGARFVRRRRSA